MRLDDLEARAPDHLDMGDPDSLAAIDELVDAITTEHPTLEDIAAYEDGSVDAPTAVRAAARIAHSHIEAADHSSPVDVSVVVAMYNEHERLLPRSEHPHGENSLLQKVAQLDALHSINPVWSWQMLLVDDGCPNGSGAVAQRIVDEHSLEDRVRVMYLADGIAEGSPGVGALRSTDESRKGGSIEYGLWTAAADARPNHVAVFTDADLSTHLGQVPSLVLPIVDDGAAMSIGSRREPGSVVVKGGSRAARGRLFIYLWKQMLGPLAGVTDTQCGFKALRTAGLRDLVESTIEKQFAFDIELLLLTDAAGGAIDRFPVAWIDSEAASTTDDGIYLTMLKAVATMYRGHDRHADQAEAFVELVEEMSPEAWHRLLDNAPMTLLDHDPTEFDELGPIVAAEEIDRLSAGV